VLYITQQDELRRYILCLLSTQPYLVMAIPRIPWCAGAPGSFLLSAMALSFWLRRYSATHSLPGVLVSTKKYPGQ
jgi:hypothetical protein